MRSDIINIKEYPADAALALNETERAAAYNQLPPQHINTLRLLAEEQMAVTADLLKKFSGQFWLENEGNAFELHFLATSSIGLDQLDSFVDLSTSKSNTYPRGLKGRISAVIDSFLMSYDETATARAGMSGMLSGVSTSADSIIWSMSQYQLQATPEEKKEQELEGIEKSIIERYADDIEVTVRTNRVELVVKKKFE